MVATSFAGLILFYEGGYMPLILIESPNKISKLQSILGPSYKIMASVGHIMDLSKKKMGVDLDTFTLDLKVNPDKKDIAKNIKEEAKKHDVIYLATDPDREGEAIAFHLATLLPSDGVQIHRVKFNAITKDAVKKAIKNPEVLDANLYDAQKARRIIDRLVGFRVSPTMWNKGMIGTSAGRVQSVALRILSEREKDIANFKPQEYWTIKIETELDFDADFWGVDGKEFEIHNEESANSIKKDIESSKKKLEVSEYTTKKRARNPYPPFTTSTLQQAASTAFGWGAKKTMTVAQNLFGFGLITYHRTDSTRTDPEKVKELREKIEQTYGKKYLSPSAIDYSPKDSAQDAHEAIRPTYDNPVSAIAKDEKKLLALIDSRFMASQMASAEFDQVSLKLDIDASKKYSFKKTGSTLVFDGFLKVYGDQKEDVILPALTMNQSVGWKNIIDEQHFTKPPSRYSDASIIKILEKEGVGRPSTYASILETLEERSYLERKGNSLNATEIGIMVSEFLEENFPNIVDIGFTSEMESRLDKIAAGNLDFLSMVKDFNEKLDETLKQATISGLPKAFTVSVTCPKCSSNMNKRISKHGPFLGCSKWPECDGVLSIDGKENSKDKVETGHTCPECSNILLMRKGKNGEFFGCKSYPICKFTAAVGSDGNPVSKDSSDDSDSSEGAQKCDKCGKGSMLKRKGKFGFFLGCSNYPKCKNIMKIPK